jgi:phosphatidylglycerophosphate synthase
VLGRPVLDHLIELARGCGASTVAVHARFDEHASLRASLSATHVASVQLVTGPPPENALILRSDRLYDPSRLRQAVRRGRDPETAVIWRLDRPRGLDGAGDEMLRRRSYQPIGRFWALAPARALAQRLAPTTIRPNAVTLASGALMLICAAVVALGGSSPAARGITAALLGLALVLDTADGHLARLQGTASDFGRWLDAQLDELGDMALHAAIAWSAFARTGQPGWLVLGMGYAMGKYLFITGAMSGESPSAGTIAVADPRPPSGLRALAVLAGHADVRWHLWIVLAACGRLDLALITYAAYFPLRAIAGAARKAVRHG